MRKTEQALIVFSLVSVILKDLIDPVFKTGIIIGIGTLSAFYIFFLPALLLDITWKESIKKMLIISWFKYEARVIYTVMLARVLSISLIAILFTIQLYPGYLVMSTLPLILLSAFLVYSTIQLWRFNTVLYKKALFRILSFLIVILLQAFV